MQFKERIKKEEKTSWFSPGFDIYEIYCGYLWIKSFTLVEKIIINSTITVFGDQICGFVWLATFT